MSSDDLAQFFDAYPLYCFCSPNITRIGKKALVDVWQSPEIVEKFLKPRYPQFDYEEIYIGGHNDSVFSVLKPGLVIASNDLREYEHVFKDWKILYFDDPNWSQVKKWQSLKSKNKGKWWVPDQEDNDEFTNFVEQWLSGWTGYVEETIFDVNCLVLDERHVVVNTPNPVLIDLLKQNGMEAIVCPLRHRFFWDGGWHCLTLDIRRRGSQIDHGL